MNESRKFVGWKLVGKSLDLGKPPAAPKIEACPKYPRIVLRGERLPVTRLEKVGRSVLVFLSFSDAKSVVILLVFNLKVSVYDVSEFWIHAIVLSPFIDWDVGGHVISDP